jgi:hypothetical protein
VLPFTLAILRGAFGQGYFLRAFVFVQAFAGLSSSTWLGFEICRFLGARRGGLLLAMALAFPQIQASRCVQSESLAYTGVCLVLVFSGRLLLGELTRRNLVWLAVSAVALISVRTQFAYVGLWVAASALFFIGRVDRTLHQRARTAGSIVAVGFAAIALQGAYTFPRTGHLSGVPFTGIQLARLTTYLASPSELATIADPDARTLALAVYERARQDGDLVSTKTILPRSVHFGTAEANLVFDYYHEFDMTVAHTAGTGDDPRDRFSPDDWYAIDRTTMTISRDLLRMMWPRYIRFAIENIYEWTRYTGILNLLLLVTGTWQLARTRGASTAARLAVLFSGLWIANALLVSLLQPVQMRYSFYFDTSTLAFVLAMLIRHCETPNPEVVG